MTPLLIPLNHPPLFAITRHLTHPSPLSHPPTYLLPATQSLSHRAEVALWNLCQTGTVLATLTSTNQHARTMGLADTPLMSLYQHSLKKNIQLAVVMSNIERVRQLMGIQQGQPAHNPVPSTSTSTPTPNPNAMDLSAFQKAPSNRLSDAERARWVQQSLCFCCGQAGHMSCLNGAEINCLHTNYQ
ncbi:uncharacterized protein VP01_6713g1 [Puccinia sorghi]|uniref:Uncharacterized protein n=1 Tax=Puccinia sorghi TaxID=27349 RepID=A0A0L6UEW1_9BASI|nr:uncharacterized protein VP01_6713g1 [Puccinia sorghi]